MTQGTIQPGARQFTPRAGTWLADLIAKATSRLNFVAADEDPTLLIGTIMRTGNRYQGRTFSKPMRVTTTAKSEPQDFEEATYNSVSTAVWDIRRRHAASKGD